MSKEYEGPVTEFGKEIHSTRHRQPYETYTDYVNRYASATAENEEHRRRIKDAIGNQRFLPAGRQQLAVGSPAQITPFNCYVDGIIEDSIEGIWDSQKRGALTLRQGGGMGFNFGTIRPKGAPIATLGKGAMASGPVSFMGVHNAMCKTIMSAGERRGAMMGTMPVWHPDIMDFVTAKSDQTTLDNFNVSVMVTDKFMECLKTGEKFPLEFDGKVYEWVDPTLLWETIMRQTYDWAEPGVLFHDTINRKNNLRYCERIDATNPCAEQPLPPYGACLLGSFNLPKYIFYESGTPYFNWAEYCRDISTMVWAVDNVIDTATFPLEEQKTEALNKRRMGLGITGFANASEILGDPYGSENSLAFLEAILENLNVSAYYTSVQIAKLKGPFPLFNADKYLEEGTFASKLPDYLRENIKRHGIRNSHLTSIAPTGTISIGADNVSSGIEPVFNHQYNRKVKTPEGERTEVVSDYAVKFHGVFGKTADEVTIDEHLSVLEIASNGVDSAVSKTLNLPEDIPWKDFKNVYLRAYEMGASGCTTFRNGGKRGGILTKVEPEKPKEPEGAACFFDPETGIKSCE